jgi:hAT family C-terminal dimerisation region
LFAQPEYAHYFEDPDTDFCMLNKYPNVRKVFIKYYAMIPASAPVERLFSFGGMIHSAKKNRLSDKTFETLLLLKSNASFFKK